MISIRTASASGFGMKSYSFLTVENLDDLKKKLIESEHKHVHLITTDAWDGAWSYERSNIIVNEIAEADIAWLMEPCESSYSARYLVCRL